MKIATGWRRTTRKAAKLQPATVRRVNIAHQVWTWIRKVVAIHKGGRPPQSDLAPRPDQHGGPAEQMRDPEGRGTSGNEHRQIGEAVHPARRLAAFPKCARHVPGWVGMDGPCQTGRLVKRLRLRAYRAADLHCGTFHALDPRVREAPPVRAGLLSHRRAYSSSIATKSAVQ